jgi:thioredoxin reductase
MSSSSTSPETHQVIVVGAGPGGIAVAAALKDKGIDDLLVLDKGCVGQAWLDYPEDTHLLSGSDPGHDENMIADVPTSDVFPNIPHPSHVMYQKYLEHVAEVKKIEVRKDTQVETVIYNNDTKQFVIMDKMGQEFVAQYVVWAAGMYTTPNEDMDSEGCYIHYARVPYLSGITAPEVTVVGSANGASGVVLQVARPGHRVTLVTSHEYTVPQPIDCLWKEQMQFVMELKNQGLVKIVENFRVKRVYFDPEQKVFVLESEDGTTLTSPQRPILCTGFLANIKPIKELITEYSKDHETLVDLSETHEARKTPNLYLAGVVGKLDHEQGFIRHFRNFGPVIADDIKKKS